MAEIQEKTTKSKPRSRWFMGCFGLRRPKKNLHDYMDNDLIKTASLRKKSRWFSWSKFLMKKSAAGKTVPVDAAVSEKFNKIQSVKLEMKISSKKQRRRPDGANVKKIPAVAPDQAVIIKTHKKITPKAAKDITLENREKRVQTDTWQKPSRRKKEKKRTGSSDPGLPPVQQQPLDRTTTLLPNSTSFRKEQTAVAGVKGNNVTRDKPGQEIDGKFDSVIGLSIIMVALVTLLLCGKLCAILSSSAWLYTIPRLRKVTYKSDVIEEIITDSNGIDLNSEEYKKKVVLDGLLQRNRRSTTVVGML